MGLTACSCVSMLMLVLGCVGVFPREGRSPSRLLPCMAIVFFHHVALRCRYGVLVLAQELENPLGWDVNDIDLSGFQVGDVCVCVNVCACACV